MEGGLLVVGTSYFAAARKVPVPVSISLYPPQWFDGWRFSRLAPTARIFSERKAGLLSDQEFEAAFVREVLERQWSSAHEMIGDLAKFLQEATGSPAPSQCTLLCFERPGEVCHRRFVANWAMKSGIVMEEATGVVPARPSPLAAQHSLEYEQLD